MCYSNFLQNFPGYTKIFIGKIKLFGDVRGCLTASYMLARDLDRHHTSADRWLLILRDLPILMLCA